MDSGSVRRVWLVTSMAAIAEAIGLAGCTSTRQVLSDATGWVSKKLDPSPPPSLTVPAQAAQPSQPPVPKAVARELGIAVTAGQDLNPDDVGRPSPVIVRLYLLRAHAAFANAGFRDLFERDVATLGQDLVDRQVIQLRPAGSEWIRRELPAHARYLGVMAAFRQIEQSAWRVVSGLPEPPPPAPTPPARPLLVSVRIAVDAGRIAVSI
jgi:type VI secretion system protein VasD